MFPFGYSFIINFFEKSPNYLFLFRALKPTIRCLSSIKVLKFLTVYAFKNRCKWGIFCNRSTRLCQIWFFQCMCKSHLSEAGVDHKRTYAWNMLEDVSVHVEMQYCIRQRIFSNNMSYPCCRMVPCSKFQSGESKWLASIKSYADFGKGNLRRHLLFVGLRYPPIWKIEIKKRFRDKLAGNFQI